MIKKNISDVEEKIRAACIKAGRNADEVKLIAVSKTKPVEDIEEAYDYGIRDFGENKVQELDGKYPVLPKDINWHLIGHLQRNKVKYIVDKVKLIHSVDSVRLAEQISLEAEKKNVEVNILVQVNIANEDTKFGLNESETIEIIKQIGKLSRVHIKGLMTIAPFTDNPEDNRCYFRGMKELAEKVDSLNIDNVEMKELSMGMTGDYEVAIEEGATLVRVGTGIFGNRNYNI